MPGPYSLELRERVVRAYEAGEGTYPDLAEEFAIGEATVKRWVWLYERQSSVEPRPRGGGTPSTIGLSDVQSLIERLHDPTAGELTAAFNQGRRGQARLHVSSMKRALYRFGYVVKKSAAGRWRVFAPTS